VQVQVQDVQASPRLSIDHIKFSCRAIFCEHNNASAKVFAIVFIHEIWWPEYCSHFIQPLLAPNVTRLTTVRTLQSRSGQRINQEGSHFLFIVRCCNLHTDTCDCSMRYKNIPSDILRVVFPPFVAAPLVAFPPAINSRLGDGACALSQMSC
jgi:hypothetical protein